MEQRDPWTKLLVWVRVRPKLKKTFFDGYFRPTSTYLGVSLFSGLSVTSASIKGYEVQLTWSVSGLSEQIQGYVVLYKPAKQQEALWSFKRKKQTQATLVPLQPLTNYTAWVLGHTALGNVFGSNTIHFVTTGGTVIKMSVDFVISIET